MKFNTIILAFLISACAALFSGSLTRSIYFHDQDNRRGFSIEVKEVEATSSTIGEANIIEIGMLLAEGDIEKGKSVFNRCALCHTSDKGGNNKTGPNLWDILNKKSAINSAFSYSEALKTKNIIWNFENLAKFISKPSHFVPGTKMMFAGIRDKNDLANLLLYLNKQSDKPVSLPNKDVSIAL